MSSSDSRLTAPLLRLSDSSRTGVLLLHGITGSPASMRPLAEAVWTRSGASVSVPRLHGHGTVWQDLHRSRWADWIADANAAYDELAAAHDNVVIVGLSMGGGLALDLASRKSQVKEVVLVNPAVFIDSPAAPLLPLISRVMKTRPAIGNSIAKPGQDELAYERTPLRAVDSMHRSLPQVRSRLWRISAPVTLCVSGMDDVVGPKSARFIRAHVQSPLRTVALRRSRHVATLDWDAPLIEDAVIEAMR